RQGVSRYPRLLDVKKNWQESDAWHYFLGDRYAHTFLRQTGWNDSHQYASPETDSLFPSLRAALLKVYEKSLEYSLGLFFLESFLVVISLSPEYAVLPSVPAFRAFLVGDYGADYRPAFPGWDGELALLLFRPLRRIFFASAYLA
ncbi:hypothetical protein VU13_03170, partial [Desulfobulbus sp. US5]|nr:hypothetical protein [Desulfobulbus sp. US5]